MTFAYCYTFLAALVASSYGKKNQFVETIGLYDVTKVKLRVHFEMRARAKESSNLVSGPLRAITNVTSSVKLNSSKFRASSDKEESWGHLPGKTTSHLTAREDTWYSLTDTFYLTNERFSFKGNCTAASVGNLTSKRLTGV